MDQTSVNILIIFKKLISIKICVFFFGFFGTAKFSLLAIREFYVWGVCVEMNEKIVGLFS